MPRRKISTNRKEEIEYRLLELNRRRDAYGGPEVRVRYESLLWLAQLWEVPPPVLPADLKSIVMDARLKPPEVPQAPVAAASAPAPSQAPEDSPAGAPSTILGELGD